MALTPSGAISLGDMNTALSRSATARISLGEFQVRYVANQDSGSVSMNNLRNKYTFAGTLVVGYYYDGKSEAIGYGEGGVGSISGQIFGPVSEMAYDIGTDTGACYVIFRDAAPGSFNFRCNVNQVGGTMVPYYGSRRQWQRNGYTPVMFTMGMVGGTYSWQFTQI